MRTRTLLLLAVVVTVVPVGWHGTLRASADRGPATPVGVTHVRAASPGLRALLVLRRWDQRRFDAWASGDPGALSRLYVPGSVTGARDTRALRRWTARGLRVTDLRQQVASFGVAYHRPGLWVVVLTDRTLGGIAVGGRRPASLPASAWSSHRIRLERSARGWRVAEVRDQPAR